MFQSDPLSRLDRDRRLALDAISGFLDDLITSSQSLARADGLSSLLTRPVHGLRFPSVRSGVGIALVGLSAAGLVACGSSESSQASPAPRPSKALLPRMVIPDASLAPLADGAHERFAFYANASDAAASTPDPNDKGADLRGRGRIAGYVRGRSVAGAFGRNAPRGLVTIGTSVILWKDEGSASASIKRDLASFRRFAGKRVQAGLLVTFAARKVSSLGADAALEHARGRPPGGSDRFSTSVVFRVGSLRGNAIVSRGDGFADAAALQLAKQLKQRMAAVLRSSR